MTRFELCRRAALAMAAVGVLGLVACGNGTVTKNTGSAGSSSSTTGAASSTSGSSSGSSGVLSSSSSGTTHASSGASSSGSSGTGSSSATGTSSGSSSGSSGFPGCVGDGGFDCSVFSQLCNPATGQCVDCFQDSDCAGNPTGSICDTTSDSCVQCQAATDCPYSNPGCSNELCGACVQNSDCPPNNTCTNNACACTGNTGCGGDAPQCIISGGTGACGCSANSQCPTPDYCSTGGFSLNGVCLPPCTSDAGACLANSPTPFCDSSSGACVICSSNAQCLDAGLGTVCVAGVGCGNCQIDSDCKNAATPYCNFGTCVQCETPQQCPADAPGCNFLTNTCGGCSTNSDCPAGDGCASLVCAPICGPGPAPDGGCAACVFDSDCDAGVCNMNTGVCQ